jgi:serine/threonine-protein kinase
MAPEQTRGDAVDARTDVYALGVMLFEILTLEHVLAGLPTRAALQAVTTTGVDARPSRTKRGADLPPELEAICVRATQRAPDDRFPSTQALSEAVEQFLDGDRDLERRKVLAAGYLAEANAAAARALDAKTPAPAADTAREEALRSTMRALALTPDQKDAQRTLARLLVEVPAEMPAAAKAEREELVTAERVHGTRLATTAFISYLASIPFVLFAGVRSWLVFWVSAALCLVGAAFTAWIARRRFVSTRAFYGVLLLSVCITFAQGSWLGPFVLLPTSACLLVTVFTIYARREERFVVRLAGVAMFLVPFLADVAGLVPAGFSFEPGRVVLNERAIGLGPGPTIAALIYTSLTYILLPTLYLARVRDTMRTMEDRHFLQGWYMKRLFPAGLAE